MAMIVVAQGADTTRTITREWARLPDREKGIVLGIVRQFEAMGANDSSEQGMPPRTHRRPRDPPR